MAFSKEILLWFFIIPLVYGSQLSTVLSPSDGQRLLKYFKAPFKDLETAYYSVVGLKAYSQGGALGTPETESACSMVKASNSKSLMDVYYASSIYKSLEASCKHQFPKEVIAFVNEQIKESSGLNKLFAVSALINLDPKANKEEIISVLLNTIKEDNSVLISSRALLVAAKLTNPVLTTLLKSADIEDMAAQADEVDGRYLHFENDLQVTSLFIGAVMSVSEIIKQSPLISSEQLILFSNFLLRRKTSISSAEEAAYLLLALGKIASSTQITLARAELTSGTSVSEESPHISITVSNVFGSPLTKLTVKAESVVRSSDNEIVLSNVPLKFDGQSKYNLLFWKNSLKSGFYDVSLAVSSSSKLIGVSDLQLKVKVTTKISLINVEIGSVERELTSASLKKVEFMKKVGQLKADNQQKLIMKFQVQDLNDKSLLSPHQAFVRFLNEKTGQEVIFVAEPDKDLTFKFEVDLAVGGREQFNSVTGKYSMHLIIGDVSISNSIFWNFGDIVLQLGDESDKPKSSYKDLYYAKPEIHHLFREAEKRPPIVVSQAFALACVLPLFILFILWGSIGANLGNFRFSLKHIIFHVSLAGIFFLYYMFWVKWDMFVTLQYLGIVGSVAFVFGNAVLSELANTR